MIWRRIQYAMVAVVLVGSVLVIWLLPPRINYFGSAIKVTTRPAPRFAEQMVKIPGGTFLMGSSDGPPYEGPVHEVSVDGFWMDRTEVTVAQFREFVEATRYLGDAERWGWSAVFDPAVKEWAKVDGANWRRPMGPK